MVHRFRTGRREDRIRSGIPAGTRRVFEWRGHTHSSRTGGSAFSPTCSSGISRVRTRYGARRSRTNEKFHPQPGSQIAHRAVSPAHRAPRTQFENAITDTSDMRLSTVPCLARTVLPNPHRASGEHAEGPPDPSFRNEVHRCREQMTPQASRSRSGWSSGASRSGLAPLEPVRPDGGPVGVAAVRGPADAEGHVRQRRRWGDVVRVFAGRGHGGGSASCRSAIGWRLPPGARPTGGGRHDTPSRARTCGAVDRAVVRVRRQAPGPSALRAGAASPPGRPLRAGEEDLLTGGELKAPSERGAGYPGRARPAPRESGDHRETRGGEPSEPRGGFRPRDRPDAGRWASGSGRVRARRVR